jgi:WD40 repeat protein
MVRGHFKNQIPNWIRGLPKVQRDWSQAEQTLEGHSDSVSSVAFSPDGSKVVSGSGDRTVRVWNVATGQAEQTVEGHSDSVSSVAFSPDDRKSRSGYSMDSSRLWVTQNGLRILSLPFDFRPNHFATKGSTLAIGTRTGRVAIVIFLSDVKGETI